MMSSTMDVQQIISHFKFIAMRIAIIENTYKQTKIPIFFLNINDYSKLMSHKKY